MGDTDRRTGVDAVSGLPKRFVCFITKLPIVASVTEPDAAEVERVALDRGARVAEGPPTVL